MTRDGLCVVLTALLPILNHTRGGLVEFVAPGKILKPISKTLYSIRNFFKDM